MEVIVSAENYRLRTKSINEPAKWQETLEGQTLAQIDIGTINKLRSCIEQAVKIIQTFYYNINKEIIVEERSGVLFEFISICKRSFSMLN